MSDRSLSLDETLELLSKGDMEAMSLLPWSSNYTFLVKLTGAVSDHAKRPEPTELMGVYKPRRGESPLWDFPEGTLCLR